LINISKLLKTKWAIPSLTENIIETSIYFNFLDELF